MEESDPDPDQYQAELNDAVDDGGGCVETWEKLSEARGEFTPERRSVLKKISALGVAGSTGLVGTATAASNEEESEISLRVEEVPLSEDTAKKAVSSKIADQLINTVTRSANNRNIAEISDGTRRNITIDDQLLSFTVEFATKYGRLGIGYQSDSLLTGFFDLNRSTLSNGQRNRISGQIGWPEDTTATLLIEDAGEPIFSRSVTVDELEQLKNIVPETEDPDSVDARAIPHTEPQSGKSKGKYNVRFKNKIYVVDSDITEILFTENTDGPTALRNCDSAAVGCLADIVLAAPACRLTAAGCAFGPLACITLLLALCAPNLVLVGLSGNCEFVVRNCL